LERKYNEQDLAEMQEKFFAERKKPLQLRIRMVSITQPYNIEYAGDW